MEVTSYKAVLSVCETFELFLIDADANADELGIVPKPVLSIFENQKDKQRVGEHYIWDNEVWLKALFKALKKRRDNKQVMELKRFCKVHNMNFKGTKRILRAMYKRAKEINLY